MACGSFYLVVHKTRLKENEKIGFYEIPAALKSDTDISSKTNEDRIDR